MTKQEISLCRKGILDSMVDAEAAEFIQDLCLRLQSAAGTMESALQECVSIYDELEQMANAGTGTPISVSVPQKAFAVKDEMSAVAGMMHDALMEGAKKLEMSSIIWHAEGEPLEMNSNGNWVPCWHVNTEDGIATVCLDYYGGPRTTVPVSSLRRPLE